MNEQELLVDTIRRLNRAAVTHMLTGSMASNYWGIPRTTHDLDFVVQLSPPDVERVIREFSGPFYVSEIAARDALAGPPHQFNAIDTRSALKIDFWVLRRDPFEREMFRRRLATDLFGEPSWIATAEDVILSSSCLRAVVFVSLWSRDLLRWRSSLLSRIVPPYPDLRHPADAG